MNQNIGQQGSLVNDTCSASSDSDAFRFWRTDLGLSFLRLLFRTSAWVRSSSDFSDDPTPVGSSEEGSGGRHLYVFTLICKVIQMDTAERNKNKLLEISYRVKACSDGFKALKGVLLFHNVYFKNRVVQPGFVNGFRNARHRCQQISRHFIKKLLITKLMNHESFRKRTK